MKRADSKSTQNAKQTSQQKQSQISTQVKKSHKWPLITSTVLATLFLFLSTYLVYTNRLLRQQLNSELKKVEVARQKTPKYTSVGPCSSKECLFKKDSIPEGFARIGGYYLEYESENFGTPTTCKGFVVTEGNDTLINHFNGWISEGNTLNKIIDDKLVINLALNDLDKEVQQKIRLSNNQNQIELGIVRITPVGRGATTCTNVVEVLFTI